MNAGEGEAIRALVVDDEARVASMVGRWLERAAAAAFLGRVELAS